MRIVYTVVFILTMMLSSFDLSSQFECLPNGAPIPGVPRVSPSSSFVDTQHPPASSVSPTRSHFLPMPSSPVEPNQQVRSRSPTASSIYPPTVLPSSDGHGYELDQLRFIRLTPTKNPYRHFALRRYTFPANKGIKVLTRRNVYGPVPSQEQIVLSTSNGDIFAILSGTYTLAGMYIIMHNNAKKRAKINMESGLITPLTSDETEEVPVGPTRQILHNFRVEHVNDSNGFTSLAEPSLPASSRSRPTFPFSSVLGYALHQLPFIWLTSRKNPNRLFELRRYTFSADKPIKILAGRHGYRPIPIQEQIVLSTFGGDVLAIFESSNALAGIYVHSPRAKGQARAKINMESGRIIALTKREIAEVPVGTNRPISGHFIVHHANHYRLYY